MNNQYISIENLKFLLHEVHHVEDLKEKTYYQEYNQEAVDMMVDAAKQIADTMLFPYFEEIDRFGSDYKDGTIQVHPHINKFFKAAGDGGWISAMAPAEVGGMQLPSMVNTATNLIFKAANNSMVGYPGLTSGAAKLVYSFGNQDLIDTYIPKMFAGEWQGTMALTEPQAGSSLSEVQTSAEPREEGHYHIQGQKIFISSGDYSGVENVVHLMLARIKGAPKGTKGISLFVVPKFRVDAEEGLVFNNVTTAGAFHKLGQTGYANAHIMMGEQGACRGYLLGEANKGLSYMFQMMNSARISVGMIATGIASAAYYASLKYANERSQGRNLNGEPGQTLIINHPDVRRLLFSQKAFVEGTMSLLMEVSKYEDLAKVCTGEEQEKYHLLLELLTPIAKTYPSEAGILSVSNGMQVLGGYGYCKDFPLEQLYRDIRITTLYEGTTGIQSMDLLGRKVMMKGGKALYLLLDEINESIAKAKTHDNLKKYAQLLEEEIARLGSTSQHLIGFAMSGKKELFIADATLYLELFSINMMAWQWLKQAIVAQQHILTDNPQGDKLSFYESKLHLLKFYFNYEVPKTLALVKSIISNEGLTIASTSKEMII